MLGILPGLVFFDQPVVKGPGLTDLVDELAVVLLDNLGRGAQNEASGGYLHIPGHDGIGPDDGPVAYLGPVHYDRMDTNEAFVAYGRAVDHGPVT